MPASVQQFVILVPVFISHCAKRGYLALPSNLPCSIASFALEQSCSGRELPHCEMLTCIFMYGCSVRVEADKFDNSTSEPMRAPACAARQRCIRCQ